MKTPFELIKAVLAFSIIGALFAGLGAVAPTSSAATSADSPSADSRQRDRCITKAEFRRVKRGHSLTRVRSIVGVIGRTTSFNTFSDGDAWRTQEFTACGRRYSYVAVSLEKTEYERWVSDIVCYDWDGDGYEEDCEDYGGYETRYRLPFVVTSKSAYWG